MRSLRPVLLVPLVLVLGVSDARAQAYERAQGVDTPLCRSSRTFTYALTTSATHPTAEQRAAVLAAINTWAQAASSCSDLVFEQAADVPNATPVPQDGKTLVTFRYVKCQDVVPQGDACYLDDTCGDKYDCWAYSSSQLVNPGINFVATTGVITGTRLEINGTGGTLTTVEGSPCPQPGVVQPGCVGWDVQRLMTTGIGQALGFALIPRTDSTMAQRVTWGELSKRAIDPGTQQGICELFPRGQPTPGCPTAPATDGGTATDGGSSADAGTGTDGGTPGGGTEPPPEEPTPPAKSGCGATSAAPLLGALVLLLGLRRRAAGRSA